MIGCNFSGTKRSVRPPADKLTLFERKHQRNAQAFSVCPAAPIIPFFDRLTRLFQKRRFFRFRSRQLEFKNPMAVPNPQFPIAVAAKRLPLNGRRQPGAEQCHLDDGPALRRAAHRELPAIDRRKESIEGLNDFRHPAFGKQPTKVLDADLTQGSPVEHPSAEKPRHGCSHFRIGVAKNRFAGFDGLNRQATGLSQQPKRLPSIRFNHRFQIGQSDLPAGAVFLRPYDAMRLQIISQHPRRTGGLNPVRNCA